MKKRKKDLFFLIYMFYHRQCHAFLTSVKFNDKGYKGSDRYFMSRNYIDAAVEICLLSNPGITKNKQIKDDNGKTCGDFLNVFDFSSAVPSTASTTAGTTASTTARTITTTRNRKKGRKGRKSEKAKGDKRKGRRY